jgi:hypothetical protein
MVVILVLGVLLFGKRLPELGRTLGEGIEELSRDAQTQLLKIFFYAVLVSVALVLLAFLWLRPG